MKCVVRVVIEFLDFYIVCLSFYSRLCANYVCRTLHYYIVLGPFRTYKRYTQIETRWVSRATGRTWNVAQLSFEKTTVTINLWVLSFFYIPNNPTVVNVSSFPPILSYPQIPHYHSFYLKHYVVQPKCLLHGLRRQSFQTRMATVIL